MPRVGRQASSSGYYHVMIRGINKEFVFQSDDERRLLLELLCDQRTSDKFELAAWCIMNSHLQTMVKAELETLSRAIKVIALRYIARYNRMHRRVGPVFGERYRSEDIEDDAYLLGALRYIHLNKVFVLGLLGGSVRGFTEFHRQSDLTLYLETSEDRESYRLAFAHKVLDLVSRSARLPKYLKHRIPKCTRRCRTTNLRTDWTVDFQKESSLLLTALDSRKESSLVLYFNSMG